MTLRSVCLTLGFLLGLAAWPGPATAQPPAPTAGELQKQVDALREQVNGMQKDLDEIKALLAPLRPRPLPAVLDLGNRPMKGEATAKLTLVELTDYQ
jgi:hypothetical protein